MFHSHVNTASKICEYIIVLHVFNTAFDLLDLKTQMLPKAEGRGQHFCLNHSSAVFLYPLLHMHV